MTNNAKEFGIWLTKCIVLGSIPGAMCWTLWTMLGGFAV